MWEAERYTWTFISFLSVFGSPYFLELCYGSDGFMRYDVSHSHLTVPECFADCRGGERCPRGDRAMEGDAGMSLLYA